MAEPRKFAATFFAASIALGAAYIGGCTNHHHGHDRGDVEASIVVRDDHGWDHHGWYDRGGDWHGYYFDDRHTRHDDDRAWGRAHDREFEHRERHDDHDHR